MAILFLVLISFQAVLATNQLKPLNDRVAPPKFMTPPTWPSSAYYDEFGPPISVSCDLTSRDQATLVWYKDGAHLKQTSSLVLRNDNQTLTFKLPVQNQTGTYGCLAYNKAGNISHSGYIFITARKQDSRPRVVLTDPGNLVKHATVGDNITISCTFDVGGSTTGLFDLWARWLDVQMGRVRTVMEMEGESEHRRCRRPQRRRIWVRQWLTRRTLYGQYEKLLQELNSEDAMGYKNFLRVDADLFGEILHRVTPAIQKKNTNFRDALEPGLKLAITLRHLATGASYSELMYSFRVGRNTICKFIPEVLGAIIQEYFQEVLPGNVSTDQWRQIADGFRTKWNFPHACGALDGKHVRIKNPKNSGSLFYNYKGFFSILILALVDADYKFIWVKVGANGSASDAQVFNNPELRPMLEENNLGLPDPDQLPGDDKNTPYFLIGDDAFPLRTWMMKPYSRRNLTNDERIFNYRLSRARRVVENAFGLLAMRFQCLLGCLNQTPETVDSVVLSCITLHNLIRIRNPSIERQTIDHEDEYNNLVPGEWRQGRQLVDGDRTHGRNVVTHAGVNQRDYLKHYFNSQVGSVDWQQNMI